MQKNIFSYMRWINPKNAANSQEQNFFDLHASLFPIKLNEYNSMTSTFEVIRSVLILKGLYNKAILDNALNEYKDELLKLDSFKEMVHRDLPYLNYNGNKIYLPMYSIEINKIYAEDITQLRVFPNSSLIMDQNIHVKDPFKLYGSALYNSPFTRLVPLSVNSSTTDAFYHPDFESLYIIYKDGTLEQEIPLFDEYLKNYSKLDLFTRLNEFLKAYYTSDRKTIIKSLYDNQLISKRLKDDLEELNLKLERK